MRAGTRTALWTLAVAATLLATGCHGSNRRASRLAAAEPSLELPAADSTIIQGDGSGSSGTIVASAPPGGATFVDRHPMFSAPRDFYNNTNSNKVVKTGAAVVVGVPVGVYGEVKQIFTGSPANMR